MRPRRLVSVSLTLAAVASASWAAGPMSLQFSAGLTRCNRTDLDRAVLGQSSLAGRFPDSGRSVRTFDRVSGLSGRIVFRLTRVLGLEAGIGYLSTDRAWSYASGHQETAPRPGFQYDSDHTLSGVFLSAGLHGSARILGTAWEISAGPAVYRIGLKGSESAYWGPFDSFGWAGFTGEKVEYRAHAVAWGLEARIGLVLADDGPAAVMLEIYGRKARAGRFRGPYTRSQPWSSRVDSATGTLYLYDRVEASGRFPALAFGAAPPAGAGIENAREASVDLSGIGVSLGIRFNL